MMEEDSSRQEEVVDPLAYLAKMNEDIIYFNQFMCQPFKAEFIRAIIKEVNFHCDKDYWKLINK